MFKKNIDNEALTVGSVLLPILEKLGIDTIFGIPGVHTVEIYRGLEKTKIKHMNTAHVKIARFTSLVSCYILNLITRNTRYHTTL